MTDSDQGIVAKAVESVLLGLFELCTGKDIGDHIYFYAFFGQLETTPSDTSIAREAGNRSGISAKPANRPHEPKAATPPPLRSDVSTLLGGSVRYTSLLSRPPLMDGANLPGVRPYQNYPYSHVAYRHRAPGPERQIHLTA